LTFAARAALLALAPVGIDSCDASARKSLPSAVLLIGAPSPGRDVASDEDRAAAVLMAAMTAEQLGSLAGALRELEQRLSVRSNPLVEDLEDDSPDSVIRAWLAAHMPSWTAAWALSRSSWNLGADGLSVRVARDCGPGLGSGHEATVTVEMSRAACFPLWGKGGPLAERGRFAAWALARAIVLRAPTPADAAHGAEELRAKGAGISRVALVLREEDALRTDRNEERAVRSAALSIASWLTNGVDPEPSAVVALSHERPPGRLFPDLGLSPCDVLVVPRLSSLAQREDFAREVETLRVGLSPLARWMTVTEPAH
jgi:hypothetical protein